MKETVIDSSKDNRTSQSKYNFDEKSTRIL